MVYNAMKLFMEINPQLFDDCSHDYTEHQNSAATREEMRKEKWAAIADKANQRKGLNGLSTTAKTEVDPVSEDNRERLNSLKLQDGERRERRATHEKQNSVGSSRSQR